MTAAVALAPARALFVGESNPYGADPFYALYPGPPGCAGDRLCRLVLGIDPGVYLADYERRNLIGRGRWSVPRAREAAAAIRAEGHQRIVLLGAKVSVAFGHAFTPLSVHGNELILPHPSGLNRWWQRPGAFADARAVLRDFGALP